MHIIHRLKFRRLVAGYALSTVGDAGVRMLLAWITLEQRGTVAMSGVFIGSAAACVFGPLVGRWLDRYPVRDILSATCLARFTLMLTLVFMDTHTIARHAAIFAFLSAFFALAYGPAVAKTIPAIFTPEKMHEANASCGVSFLIASAGGPVLGGAVWAHYGLHAACAVFAALFLVTAPLAHFTTFPLTQSYTAKTRRSSSYAEVLRSILGMPGVLALAILGIALNFALAPINVALAPLMLSLGVGPQGFGFAMALFVVGAVVGNFGAGGNLMRMVGREQSILASMGTIALGLVAIGFSQSPLQAAFSILLIGAALPFFQVPVSTQLQRSVPAANAGQVFATLNSISLLAAPLAAAATGLLLKRLAPAQLFFSAAALSTMLCAGWTFYHREKTSASPSLDGQIG